MTEPLSSTPSLDALARIEAGAMRRVSLALHRRDRPGELAAVLDAAARQLSAATDGAIVVTEGSGTGPPGLPALTLRADDRDAVHYLAAPVGLEEAPFLEAVAALAGGRDLTDAAALLSQLGEPAELLVFIAPDCPNCPASVRVATTLAAASRLVTASIVDVTRFAEHATFFDVRSVPTTVVDGEAFFVGVTSVAQLAGLMVERRGPDGERSVFASQLSAGRFDDAARRLADGRAAKAFVEIWSRSSLEDRIGLVLTADRALEDDPRVLDALVPMLLPVLDTPDPARRGDTADLLGRIGHTGALSALRNLESDGNPDVADAASEALERIAERTDRENPEEPDPT